MLIRKTTDLLYDEINTQDYIYVLPGFKEIKLFDTKYSDIQIRYDNKNYSVSEFNKYIGYDTDYDYGEQSELYYSEVEDDEYRNRRSLRVPVMIFTAILLLAVLVLIYLLVFVPMRDGYSFTQYIDKLFEPAARLTRIIGG